MYIFVVLSCIDNKSKGDRQRLSDNIDSIIIIYINSTINGRVSPLIQYSLPAGPARPHPALSFTKNL